MVTNEEFGHLVNEFESIRDTFLEEIAKLRSDIEILRDDFDDLRKELKK